MTKYVLNIDYSGHPHTSLTFDTYEEANEYITDIYDNEHYDGSIIWYDINEVEV